MILAGVDLDRVRSDACVRHGLPHQLAGRLEGDTADQIDADALAWRVQPSPAALAKVRAWLAGHTRSIHTVSPKGTHR